MTQPEPASPAPESTSEPEPESDAWAKSRCVSTSVRRVDRALNRIYDDALRPSGLVTTQYALLSTLARAGSPVAHSRLASVQELAGTTLSRNLKPLVRDGLVRIEPGADRRTRYVAITAKGEAALERARPLWRSVQERVIAEVGDDRIEHLLDELYDLLARLRRGVDGDETNDVAWWWPALRERHRGR